MCSFPISALPQGFVYLKNIEPSIIENLRYNTTENFTGKQVEGYHANKVILSLQAAEGLAEIQLNLATEGYSLVIYDAYRPLKAVNAFKGWSKDINEQTQKEKYYDEIDKRDVFKLGYIAEKSGHSRGSTVDVSIIKLGSAIKEITVYQRTLINGSVVPYLDDGSLDMGTSFDLFGEASFHDSYLIEDKYLKSRNYLRNIMKKGGFREYSKEWWHYTLDNEPFPDSYFDFDIK